MLILTPTPLQTAAERAFFAELAGWDTGSGVRGAVMASLPVVEGPMNRRQADAVLFVPEGLAVVRVVEVERRSGVVTASQEGAWTIGSGDGPGDVVQLAGGGSTPLEGLMRAGMQAAVTLRAAGLEPGRIARLTVLTGAVTGIVPADGDLGEGDQVALLDQQSLLLGVARAARHAGTDNPRLWTTADVRAGIEALGVAGRTPSVEELNGEGFPYSPYVLRRQELLTPAALNAAPPRYAPQPLSTPEPPAAPVPQQRTPPLVDPAAAARVAAAAVQAQEDAERSSAAQVADQDRHTQDVRTYRPVEPVVQQTQALTPDRAPFQEPRGLEDSGGLGGLFGSTPTVEVAPQPRRELPPELRPRASAAAVPPTRSTSTVPPEGSSAAGADTSGRRRALLVAAALVVVAALVTVVVVLVGERDGAAEAPQAGPSSSAAPDAVPAGPAPGDTQVVDGTTFTLEATTTEDTCADHAYGAVADFFARSDCTSLTRSLWSAEVDGRPAVVSRADVTMPDADLAAALVTLADTDGSGNVNDLLREGTGYPGGPERLSSSREYASRPQDAVATIVETAYVGGQGSSEELDALASAALALGSD
ncbi:hypothetical protein O2W14_07335 [Modestobacter sp. VKM Ac-2986]|uniref:hypothetical protein n=1 Tax=Modestobacter sp. VKM Ac-2986 TaxID=3004140 RepID=UPI0022AB48B5|nr:hypothetical protein [Modestobacter sp. VKM Ac-2986]MCZ2828641.1 hypothetical protein [Modestobacter sp. VKM Ac-2986]